MRHSRGIPGRARAAAFMAAGLALSLALTSCSWDAPHPRATGSPPPSGKTAASVTLGGGPGLSATASRVEITSEMRAAAAGGVVHDVASLVVKGGSIPSSGADLTFTLPTALPDERPAVIAQWNEDSATWQPMLTAVSADRMKLSAKLLHFSIYGWLDGETVSNLVGQKVIKPLCDGRAPDWAKPQYFDDSRAPVLWCVGTDPANATVMEVRLRLNRQTAGSIMTAVRPVAVHSDLWGASPPVTWFALEKGGNLGSALVPDTYPVQPLSEYDFEFDKGDLVDFWRATRDKPLIEITSTPADALAGPLYAATGTGKEATVAYVTTLMSLIECGAGTEKAAADSSMTALFSAVAGCVNKRGDDIVAGTVRYWVARQPNADPAATRAVAVDARSSIARALGAYAAIQGTLHVGTVIGDLLLNPVARQLIFAPSDAALKQNQKSPIPAAFESITAPPMCERQALRLVGGQAAGLAVTDGYTELVRLKKSDGSKQTLYAENAGSADPRYAVDFGCSKGGVSWPDVIGFYSADLQLLGYSDLGDLDHNEHSSVREMQFKGGSLAVRWETYEGAGFGSCNGGPDTRTGTFTLQSDGRVVSTNVVTVPCQAGE
jgi:hypothetical protein